jgi:GNAT superfamily N-acetyltransferase
MPVLSEAVPGDIPDLCELLGLLFAQEAEFHPDKAAQERGLTMILANPAVGRIYVLREKGRVIGMANLLYTVSTALGARVALLEDVVIAPPYRHKGLGGMLLEHLKEEAARDGCRRITLLTDADNRAGRQFYARHGFSESGMLPLRFAVISKGGVSQGQGSITSG